MILTNLVFVVACTLLLGLQKLLYGSLRPIEIEQLYEKAWFAVTETCLAMTIFRGEIGAWFLIMFFALLAGKVWGWIGEGRVEILEQQPPRNPRLFHTRLALSLGLGVAFDLTMLEYVVKQVMRMARPDMMVMFGFEFAVLSITSLSTAARYAINLVEIGIVREQKRKRAEEMKTERIEAARRVVEEAQRRLPEENNVPHDASDSPTPTNAPLPSAPAAPSHGGLEAAQEALRAAAERRIDESEVEVEGWEEKGRWIFYLDLATDFFKLVVYLAFFFILLVFYGLPIHIVRDVFLTMRSFLKRISDFIKYRAATRDMNERYPDATAEEIGHEDLCIICREEMRPYQPTEGADGEQGARSNPIAERMRPKKLPCGHILHFSCLRSWLERQQICPTCRANVVSTGRTQQTTPAGQAAPRAGEQGQHRPPPEAPGPRVYQFGPLRIGVGAARGNNMFEELQQQLADGRAGALPRANANGPQQYGFGIRWDGLRNRRHHRRGQSLTAQEQLDAAERQIHQEIEELARTTHDLGLLRSMQAELQRIRGQRSGDAQQQTPSSTTRPGGGATDLSSTPVQRVTLTTDHHPQSVMEAGSDRLPQGLTLPPGWTMMPLQPAEGPLVHVPLGLPTPLSAFVNGPWGGMAPHGMMPGQALPPFPVGMFPAGPMNRPPRVDAPHAPPSSGPQGNGDHATQAQSSASANGNHNSTIGATLHAAAAPNVHDEWLASLRASASPSDRARMAPGPRGSEGRTMEGTNINGVRSPMSNGLEEPPASSAASLPPPLPSSSATTTSDEISGPSTLHVNGDGERGPSSGAESSSSPKSSERKNRTVTVEDFVDDPD